MKLFKAVATIGGMTLLSRIAGFIRDMLTAVILGAGPVADAFFVALKLPNFCRRITAEGAFSAAFIPIFSGKVATDGKDEALKFARDVQAMMLMILLPFSLIVMMAMPFVIHVIAPGFSDGDLRFELAVNLSKITFPYVVLISIVALLGGMMNSFDRFAPFASMPIFFNLALISALLYVMFGGVTPTPAHALAVGVIGAGVLQLLWMLYHAYRMKIMLKIKAPEVTLEIKKVFKLMGPSIIGSGVAQINVFIDMILASLLPMGAISYLYYADRLYQFPLAMIGISVGTALLPVLAKKIKAKKIKESKAIFAEALELGWVLSVPAAVGLALLARNIIGVLFEYGAFTVEDSLMSARALQAYALALPAFIGIKILSSASFAAENTKTPVRYAIIGSVVNIIMSLVLLVPLQHVGIALATALGAWVNLILLGISLNRHNSAVAIGAKEIRQLGTIIFCSVFMASTLILFYALWPKILMPSHKFGEFMQLITLIILGGISYFIALYLTGNKRIFKNIISLVKKKS